MVQNKYSSNREEVSKVKLKNEFLLKELEKARVAEQQKSREVELLRARLAGAENQIKIIKSSVTFRAGVLLVSSRSIRGLIRLPWRLIKLYREYMSARKHQTFTVVAESKTVSAHKETDSRDEVDRYWVSYDHGIDDGESSSITMRNEGLVGHVGRLSAEVLLKISLPIGNSLESAIELRETSFEIHELDSSGNVLNVRTLASPVSGWEQSSVDANGENFSLAFVHRLSSEADAVNVLFEKKVQKVLQKDNHVSFRCKQYKEGISVVIPSYQGVDTVIKCLESLYNQTLSFSKFEIVLVLNGPDDGTESVVRDFSSSHKNINLNVFWSNVAGAGEARNMGLSKAAYEFVTFVDDDDYVSNNYLELMLGSATHENVAISGIVDVNREGEFSDSSINQQIMNAKSYSKCEYKDVSSVLTMNACKTMLTFFATQLKFNTNLRSGEDVCYFSRYFTKFSPSLCLVPAAEGAKYFRFLSDGSVSRQAASFEFNVKQRLDVIKSLDKYIPFAIKKKQQDFLQSKINAQLSFVKTYLSNNREDYSKYHDVIQGFEDINYRFDRQLASALSETLVYSYCFPPYLDTAGIVMAKRIHSKGEPVDVISNNMDGVREVDNRLEHVVKGLVGKNVVLKGRPSFSNWREIRKFAEDAQDSVRKIEKTREPYRKIYSRAMWVASHFAAVLHKIRNRDVYWVAEFSDPLLKDIHGNDRDVDLDRSWLENAGVIDVVNSAGLDVPESNNLFYWCEFLVYVLADEIIFTNSNQLEYMMSYSSLPKDVGGEVLLKCRIDPHPTFPSHFYNYGNADYEVFRGDYNIAYFGSFYATRGLGDVFKSLVEVNEKSPRRIVLHIFTSKVDEAKSEVEDQGYSEFVKVNSYLPYFEFISLTNSFDCLVVNDAITKGVKPVNPYLPSKLSDYLGSSASVWAICEEGSVLHNISTSRECGKEFFVSYIGDGASHIEALGMMLKKAAK